MTSGAVSLISYVQKSFDPVVFGATASASYKLFLICLAVGWLLKTKKIPNETASVLSQARWENSVIFPLLLYYNPFFQFSTVINYIAIKKLRLNYILFTCRYLFN